MKVDPSGMQMTRRIRLLVVACWMSGAFVAPWAAATPDSEPRLYFVDSSGDRHTLTLSRLRAVCDEEEIEVEDPYHERATRYVAMKLRCVLDLGFERTGGAEGQRTQGLLLHALDGYTRPVRGEDLLEPGHQQPRHAKQ